MIAELTQRLLLSLEGAVTRRDGILAAVSGGSDSTALLVLLAECRKTVPFRLAACTVDHGLRSGVEREIALVQRLTERLDIPLAVAKIPKTEATVALRKGSLQAWARDRRYALLQDAAKDMNARLIATGHTRDDQAETVLLRLLRGTGVDGLRGIPKLRSLDDGVRLLRPLLDFGREELRRALRDSDIPFADDPSNDNPHFLRVRVRNELLPLMNEMSPGVSARLAALSGDAASLVSFLEKDATVSTPPLFEPLRLARGIRVADAVFDAVPRGLWGRVIRRAIERVQGNLRRIERTHLTAVEQCIQTKKSTGRLPLPMGPVVFAHRGALLLFPEPLPPRPEDFARPTALGDGCWAFSFPTLGAAAEICTEDAEAADDLEVRARRPGDRLLGSSKRFKTVLIDGKVPRPYRDFIPVLAKGDRVISCPFLLSSRNPALRVDWRLDESSPFWDVCPVHRQPAST